MNPKSLLVLLTGIFVFISCSKEESFEKRNTDTDEKGPMLVKVTMQPVGATYTNVITLAYDNHKRLMNIKDKLEGEIDEPYVEEESVYYRNAAGMIERMVGILNVYDENNSLQERDSVALNLHFTAGGQYTYGLRTVSFSSNSVTDSIAYSYNDKERIALVDIFRKDAYSSYEREQTTRYNYDEKGNISTMTIMFADNGQDPPQVIAFEYNDKLSPMNFGDEALLNGFVLEGVNSPHCLTSIHDVSEPDISWEMSYDYNDFNRPAKGVYNNTLTQEKINLTYFYQ
jgi:hypothetical protein